MTGKQALQMLIDGNARFVDGQRKQTHETPEWRQKLVAGQNPFAAIIGCSDARVPIELIFDQGFDDLFIIRVAGNILGPAALGSAQYAVNILNVPLLVVMGHEYCGAVTAALDSTNRRETLPSAIQQVLELIDPAIANGDASLPLDHQLKNAIRENVRRSVEKLRRTEAIQERCESGKLDIVGAVYDLESGVVEFLSF